MAMAEGGYDAKFVEEVATDIKCVVCHFPLRKPVQFIQCGHRFCEDCFEQMKNYSITRNTDLCCPLDRMVINSNQVFPDKGLERTILSLKVRCSNVAKGCIWVNDLRDLQPHLDADCDYTIVTCQNEGCNKQIQRNMLQQHVVQYCGQKDGDCNGKKIKELIAGLSSRLLECEMKIRERDGMLMMTEIRLINCEKDLKVTKHKLEKNEKNLLVTEHALSSCEKELKTTKDRLRDCEEKSLLECEMKMKEKDERLINCEKDLKVTKDKLLVTEHALVSFKKELKTTTVRLGNCEAEALKKDAIIKRLSSVNSMGFFQWTINNYNSVKWSEELNSPYFYSSYNGYKCQLMAKWYGPERGRMGLYFFICKGENDDELVWPFPMKVRLQSTDRNGVIKSMTVSGWKRPEVMLTNGIGSRGFLQMPQLAKHIQNNKMVIYCFFDL